MTVEDHATLKAYIEGVDLAARTAERTWGMDRLPMLVDDELRAKFYRQQAKWRASLEAAYEAASPPQATILAVASTSAATERAWAALDASARQAGHQPIAPTVWETRLSAGDKIAIIQTNAEASALIGSERYRAVYTIDEIGHLLDALPELIGQAKATFDGATVVTSQRKFDRSWVREGDAIPF